MVEHLNYCRQMIKQFSEERGTQSVAHNVKAFKEHCINLAQSSQKFILPDGGRLYDDPEYKALDETERLRLPFPLIAVEFTRSENYVGSHKLRAEDSYQPHKSLLFAREQGETIAITVIVWAEHIKKWIPYPEVALPRTNYLDRSVTRNGYVSIKIAKTPNAAMDVPADDYSDEIGALLCMLNILNCKNVRIDQSHPGKTRQAMQRTKKNALPFDSYNILTIAADSDVATESRSSGHRSPREHLRRGHIRRLADGRRVWVNAALVCAGSGGRVVKDYALK